jgi:putative transcriptional regulator
LKARTFAWDYAGHWPICPSIYFAGVKAATAIVASSLDAKEACDMGSIISSSAPRQGQSGFFDGQLLIAMPGMLDDRFARAVIYVCAHSEEGAMGIIVNRPAETVDFSQLLVQLNVIAPDEAIRLPAGASSVPVLNGGPVDTSRGFVLHSNDYSIENSTLPIRGGVSLTATIDILRAIARGSGPGRALLALGYAGWAAGQLEAEMGHNGWLNCPADHALIFDSALDSKYERAFRQAGIDLGQLSSDAGNA